MERLLIRNYDKVFLLRGDLDLFAMQHEEKDVPKEAKLHMVMIDMGCDWQH